MFASYDAEDHPDDRFGPERGDSGLELAAQSIGGGVQSCFKQSGGEEDAEEYWCHPHCLQQLRYRSGETLIRSPTVWCTMKICVSHGMKCREIGIVGVTFDRHQHFLRSCVSLVGYF